MAQRTVEFCVDWLNFTCYRLNTIGWYLVAKKFPDEAWTATKAHHGYTLAAQNNGTARVMVNPDRPDMGQHVQYAGGTLNIYRNEGISARDILKHHAAYGDICKRIDLAFDMRDSAINIQTYHERLTNGTARAKAKKHSLILGSDGGATLYIGVRGSEQFIRIYDKGIESGMGGNWKRIELELKGSRAIEVSRMLATGDEQDAMKLAKGLLLGQIDFKTDDWTWLTGEAPITIAKAKDNAPDTELWLMTQVATAMARVIKKQGTDALLSRFVKRVEALVSDETIT